MEIKIDDYNEEAKANLVFAYECKHSVRYNSIKDGSEKVIVSVYIMKTAFEDNNYPKTLTMVIK